MSDQKDEHPQAARIRERAYMIWERDGRPDGHALLHWVKAREEVEAEDQPAASGGAPARNNTAG
ncbi:MAG: DUF2934 domain-containing protein [Alphaproteobacteria bacterium]|nr:DUF2934 domain-containing protein [Alphaproteobacteria bacterium]